MSNTSSLLSERKIPDEKIEEYRDFYVELLGFVPPRIQARTDLLARVDGAPAVAERVVAGRIRGRRCGGDRRKDREKQGAEYFFVQSVQAIFLNLPQSALKLRCYSIFLHMRF